MLIGPSNTEDGQLLAKAVKDPRQERYGVGMGTSITDARAIQLLQLYWVAAGAGEAIAGADLAAAGGAIDLDRSSPPTSDEEEGQADGGGPRAGPPPRISRQVSAWALTADVGFSELDSMWSDAVPGASLLRVVASSRAAHKLASDFRRRRQDREAQKARTGVVGRMVLRRQERQEKRRRFRKHQERRAQRLAAAQRAQDAMAASQAGEAPLVGSSDGNGEGEEGVEEDEDEEEGGASVAGASRAASVRGLGWTRHFSRRRTMSTADIDVPAVAPAPAVTAQVTGAEQAAAASAAKMQRAQAAAERALEQLRWLKVPSDGQPLRLEVRELLQGPLAGLPSNIGVGVDASTPLHALCSRPPASAIAARELLVDLLRRPGASSSVVDARGRTPLHLAAGVAPAPCQLETTAAVLCHELLLNAPRADMLRMELNMQASMASTRRGGGDGSAGEEEGGEGGLALGRSRREQDDRVAALRKELLRPAVKRLLLRQDNRGRTALHIAVSTGAHSVMRVLLQTAKMVGCVRELLLVRQAVFPRCRAFRIACRNHDMAAVLVMQELLGKWAKSILKPVLQRALERVRARIAARTAAAAAAAAASAAPVGEDAAEEQAGGGDGEDSGGAAAGAGQVVGGKALGHLRRFGQGVNSFAHKAADTLHLQEGIRTLAKGTKGTIHGAVAGVRKLKDKTVTGVHHAVAGLGVVGRPARQEEPAMLVPRPRRRPKQKQTGREGAGAWARHVVDAVKANKQARETPAAGATGNSR